MPLILFDQNAPRALTSLLPGHSVRHAAEEGWGELRNGDLLKAAGAVFFRSSFTSDKNIVYQQNMVTLTIRLIVLSTNQRPTLRPAAGRILQAIEGLATGGCAYVDSGLPANRRRPFRR